MAVALTIFLSNCRTTPGEIITTPKQEINLPLKPVEKPVHFDDTGTCLTLTYDEYRKLEFNIIEMRRYMDELEKQVKKYQGDNGA